MRRDGGSVFPAHANTGDPNGPNRGLSANENACALISMMAQSKCSNQRPDTLMQDRSPPARRIHLQRTAGPYIGSKTEVGGRNREVRFTPNTGHCRLHQPCPKGADIVARVFLGCRGKTLRAADAFYARRR